MTRRSDTPIIEVSCGNGVKVLFARCLYHAFVAQAFHLKRWPILGVDLDKLIGTFPVKCLDSEVGEYINPEKGVPPGKFSGRFAAM